MKVNMGQPNDLLIDDLELLLREIDEYNSATANNKPVDIPQALENYLQFVAKSGNTVFPWPHVRTLFRTKMMSAIQQFQEPGCPSEGFILERFDMFRIAAPFTIQRLTELILQPTRHYRKKEKFLRGLEKTVLVVSTIEPRSLTGEDEKNGNDEVINTNTGEGEPENTVFNRTFSMDQQDMVTVRSSPIDVLGQNIPIVSEDIILDPVTTSVVSAAVDVINHSIGVAPDVIIGDSVTTSSGISMDVITPDIAITVPSDLKLVAIPEDSTGAIHLPQSLEAAMECESSTTPIDVSPVALLQCVADQDLVAAAITHASSETSPQVDNISVLEGVSSSLVNMDAVKLPLEESNNVSIDCHSSVATAPETTEATSLFHGVTQLSEDAAIVTPLEAAIPADDSTLSGVECDPLPVDLNLVAIPEDSTGAEAAMECESSTTPIDVSPVALLQCVADQDLVAAAITHASSETSPQVDNISILEGVSSSLVNMDAVKLPLEESNNVSIDCHSSVATAPETTEATQLSEDAAIVTPLEAAIPADDSTLSGVECDPLPVDAPTSLASSDKSKHSYNAPKMI